MITITIITLILLIIIIIYLSSKGVSKYKALLENSLLKGYLNESDENLLNDVARKYKISKKITDEIRSKRMKKDTQYIINKIYSNQLFSEDDEKQIVEIANKHRINVEFDNPDFRKFRTYWMRSNSKTHKELNKNQNAQFNATSIKTKADYDNLCKRIDKLNELYNSQNLDEIDKIEKERDKLYNIWEKSRDKVIGWQFIPEISLLDTDDEIYDLAYKVFENKSDLNKIINKYRELENDVHELTFEEEPEERPVHIDIIKRINQVSKENIPLSEILKKINDLSKPYEKYLKDYLNDNTISVGQFVVASILSKENAPIPFTLIKEGYINREDYLKIDPTEFGKRKGVGPKTVQQLIDYKNFVTNYDTEKDWNF